MTSPIAMPLGLPPLLTALRGEGWRWMTWGRAGESHISFDAIGNPQHNPIEAAGYRIGFCCFFLSQIFFCCFHPYTAGGSPFSHKHMMSLGGAFSKILFSAWEICGSWNQFDFRMPYVVFFQVGLKPPDLSQSKWPRCFQGCQVCLRNLDFLGRGFCEHLGMIKSTKWAPTSYIYL